MAIAWRISSYGTGDCAFWFIVLLAGCDEGLDVLDAFLVHFVVWRGNHGGLDGPVMLGTSWHRLGEGWWKERGTCLAQ